MTANQPAAPRPTPPTPPTPPATAARLLPQTSRYPRLSHTQWENTIQDLFFLTEPTGFSALFIGDPVSGGFDNNSEALKVTATLWTDYQRGAEQVAELVASDPALLAKFAPPTDGDSDAQATAFITSFGKRAYRRPLTAEEIARHLEIFHAGVATPGELAAFPAGVRLVVQAMLQSPHFLYRVEASEVPDGTKIRLSGHEIASKLSYMLWNTMPDDALFAAAADGSLDDPKGVAAQAARLLDHPRAHAMVANFHYQLLQVDHYSDIYKDPVKFAAYSAELNPLLASETLKFVDDVVFNDGDLATLLTAPYTFVNAKLAPFYGVAGDFSDDLVKVDLDPARRAGILTQLGFLMANAGAFENDPIHRGVFLNLQLLCSNLPPPPNMVPPLPPPVEGETLRERVDRHTGKGTCGEGCHGYLINPIGFAFENYDPLGQWQTMDAGKPVDAAAEFSLGGVSQKYDGAVELAHLMADSDEAHRCYVAHFLEYGYARRPQKADDKFIATLAASSKSGTHTIKQIILELSKSDAFLFRAPVEP
ncbi:MAG: DUF1592 domain-containing protein [Nannocystis sp.]|uniref:DUF1592 domain-containing protein n=1 Tax=Nannocystis sp. TaxID=1962667 RepID=UPI00242086EB|nr:DUF1592 domain-containing protein [Nannocystis sp.]MBK9758225.1 DUF1592 domain-containing protein [Nannocystis sp.]